ncbi:tetratricopeptide repeat protein, partial [Dysgonomonas sp. OttesenSCG-928-M03]|nr:tetratricopeptide repeat protein [Dysgonomonas sp. OttesenSCG-928-M03]
QVAIHFASVNEYSKLIGEQPENALFYFARGLDYMLVQDFISAIEDFTKATLIDPQFTLAYFNLAVAYTKQLKSRESLPELYNQGIQQSELSINMQLGGDKAITSGTSKGIDNDAKNIRSRLEYESILKNYSIVLDLSPEFSYAYYNRAEVKAMQNDFRAAILDLNEAIKQNPDFAEAYYNRGLCRLRIKDTERGLDDLRKAGELGMINAYSIIKRMTE